MLLVNPRRLSSSWLHQLRVEPTLTNERNRIFYNFAHHVASAICVMMLLRCIAIQPALFRHFNHFNHGIMRKTFIVLTIFLTTLKIHSYSATGRLTCYFPCLFCHVSLKVGFHYPSSRAEFTGRVDGPRTRVHFLTPVNSGRELG